MVALASLGAEAGEGVVESLHASGSSGAAGNWTVVGNVPVTPGCWMARLQA